VDLPVGGARRYSAAAPRVTQVGTNGVPDQVAQPVHRLDGVVKRTSGGAGA
jgi:hypothetical protein